MAGGIDIGDISGITSTLLQNVVVKVQFSGLPPIKIRLDSQDQSNELLLALRPRVTIERNGQALASVAPYGDPEEGIPAAAIILGLGVLGLGALFFFAVR